MSKFKAGDRVRCVATDTYNGGCIPVGTELTVSADGRTVCDDTRYSGWRTMGRMAAHTFELVEPEPALTVPPSPGPALADWLRENYIHETPEVQEVLRDLALDVLGVEIIEVPATVRLSPAWGVPV